MSCSIVDLFCGVGGLTKGLELAGLNVVAGIDIDGSCRFAYEQNNNARFIQGDISDINIQTVSELFPKGDTRILVGCAPCQPFSKNTQRYRKDGHRDDKWKLLYSFSDIINELRPAVVSMENVPELAVEPVFNSFTKILRELEYHCSWSIAYGPDYGVPQKRKRLVLLASLLGEITLIPALYNPENYRTVRDAIGMLPALSSGEINDDDPMHCSTKMSSMNIERIQQSVPNGTWRDWEERLKLPCHVKKTGKSYGAVYGRMGWDEPSPTITTQYYGYGNGRFGHPEQDRALSYREGAILQSFPPEYIFIDRDKPFNRRQLGVHIGNAVPVELGRAIGLSIDQHLQEMGMKIRGE